MPDQIDQQKFNDDLLLQVGDRKLANDLYPSIIHVLDNPELQTYFNTFDIRANRDKRWSRIAGTWAIAFGCSALALASSEGQVGHTQAMSIGVRIVISLLAAFVGGGGAYLAYRGVFFGGGIDQDDNRLKRFGRAWAITWVCIALGAAFIDTRQTMIAWSAAVFGLSGLYHGLEGVLFAGGKQEWLYRRVMTERLRQFHFQTLICRLPEIMESMKDDDQAKATFESERRRWLETFKAKFEGRLVSVFTEIAEDKSADNVWLHEDRRQTIEIRESKTLNQLFDAYRELRIVHQIRYAEYKLSNDHKFLSAVPLRQAIVLWSIAFIFIILICVIDIGVVFGVLTHALAPAQESNVFMSEFRRLGSLAVIWLAIGLLGVRAVEQGLQPDREAERYQQYNSSLQAILKLFDQSGNPTEKIAVMRQVETAAYAELRNFLLTNERAHFVM